MRRCRFVLAAMAALSVVGLVVTTASAPDERQADRGVSSSPVVVQYAPSFDPIPNPERGFFHQLNAFDLGPVHHPLDAASLRQYRAEGISLLRAYYVIDEFRNAPITADALSALNADFAAIRSAGIKIIPRFTYSFPCVGALEPCGPETFGDTDAPLPTVLAHIDQLAPVLQANADVIAFMEMGFVGPWGEWHNSSNGLLATPFTANANSAAIVARVLAALPARRMVNIALWHYKQDILGTRAPLTAAQAFTGTPQARIGHQDDCFANEATHGNTYRDHRTGNSDPGPARQYLSEDNRYVPQGGESCSFDPTAQPFAQCPNALAELTYIRWSALNTDYQPQVLDLWRQQGCYGEIARRLGYRLRLVGAEIPTQTARGSTMPLRMVITNDGFASPYNPRAVELVLRHTLTGAEHALPLNTDPRFWGGGETHTLDLSVAIPFDVAPGTYALFLNLPDPEATLRGNPDYSIRLANQDMWEASSGYNSLQTTITVGDGPPSTLLTLEPAFVSGSTVTLVWSAVAGALDYIVEAGTAPGSSNLFNGSVGATTTISSMAGAGTYYVRVRALTAQGLSSVSNEISFTMGSSGACAAPPPAPQGLSGAVVNGVASITWSPSASAVSYVVQAGSTPGASDVFNGAVGSAAGASSPVPAGFRAYVRVYAVNACGQSGPSNEVLLQ